MSQSTTAPEGIALPSVPLLKIGPWLVFYGLLAMLVIFFISADQGAVSIPAGNAVHEWVHDSRHLLGFPCH